MHTLSTLAVLLLTAARSASAVGCATHTYGSCADGIVHWYDPDDGQICDPLDCGGGRAPPKTTNPCCTAAYTGTAVCVDTPSYMPCFTASSTSTVVKTTTAAGATTTTTTEAGTAESAAVNGLSGYVESLTAATATGSEGSAVTSTATTSTVMTGGTVNLTTATTASGSSSAAAVATNAAGYAQRHPFMALAGAAVGVVLL